VLQNRRYTTHVVSAAAELSESLFVSGHRYSPQPATARGYESQSYAFIAEDVNAVIRALRMDLAFTTGIASVEVVSLRERSWILLAGRTSKFASRNSKGAVAIFGVCSAVYTVLVDDHLEHG